MGDISEVLQKYSADERSVTHKELHQIARGAVGLVEENDRLRDEVARLKAFRDAVVEAYLYSDRSDELLIKLDSAIKEQKPYADSEEECDG